MPDSIIVANLAEDLSAKHASENVEEFFFMSKSQSSRTFASLELFIDVISDLLVHHMQRLDQLFFRVIEIDACQ